MRVRRVGDERPSSIDRVRDRLSDEEREGGGRRGGNGGAASVLEFPPPRDQEEEGDQDDDHRDEVVGDEPKHVVEEIGSASVDRFVDLEVHRWVGRAVA